MFDLKIKIMIEEMAKIIIKNKKINGGFPMAGFFFDNQGKPLGLEINSRARRNKNKKIIKNDKSHHAEHKMLNKLKEKNIKKNKLIRVILILPPCITCLNEMLNSEYRWKIYYLTDVIRNKMESVKMKQISNEWIKKTGKKLIELLRPSKKWNKETKLYYSFLIYNICKASKDHETLKKAESKKVKDEYKKQKNNIINISNKIKEPKSKLINEIMEVLKVKKQSCP